MSVEVADDEEDDLKPALIGEVLANRYQIESRIGEGAMGAVFKAKHVKVGRPFAVKVLHKKLVEDKKVLQRFEREAELAGRLRHPNVVGVVDVGETADGFRYMVMDFAEGADLATLLGEAPMPAERIINLTRQMLEGLYHAHEQGLIHRDFKPENVIIERDDHGAEVPRIVDFGIAILREGGENASSAGRLTTNGLVLGTPHYMAPEQAVADPIDHRIDLFALGIVVYEMLCGKLPFDGTGAEVARANLLLDPPLISQRVPYLEVDPLLEAFSRRLMSKKREMRPPTAKAARELLDLITSDPASAAAALGVPVEAAAARAPAITQPVTPQREAVAEDEDFHPSDSRTPIPPTPLLYGRAPTPHPFAGGADQPGGTYLPGVSPPKTPPGAFPRAPTPLPDKLEAPAFVPPGKQPESSILRPSQREIRTDSAQPLDWERPAKSKRPLVLVVGGTLAVALVVVVMIATRGSTSTATEADHQVVAEAHQDPKPDPTPPLDDKPAPPDPTPATPTNDGSAAKPEQTEPTEIEMDPIVNTPKKPVRPTVDVKRPQTKPETKQPVLPDDLKMTKKPPVEPGALAALYGAVGRELAATAKQYGEDAVAGARANYRRVQIQDALATDAKREWANNLLLQVRGQLARAAKQKP